MKKFSFPLDTVLSYKGQVLDSLKNEHAQILIRVIKQENIIEDLEKEFQDCAAKFERCKVEGAKINEMLNHEGYLHTLQKKIEGAKQALVLIKREEQAKREEVIIAKQDTTSIEKLKEKKQEQYRKDEQKDQERFIEEFVSNTRMTANNG
ncbi:MAG: flagellar export protein FliJ [Lachnospiraceae bacterium]